MLETHAVVTPPKPGFLERLVWHDIQDGRVVKFAPDQPRDEQGRWTDVSAGGELRHVYASPTNDWAIAGFGDRQVRWAQRAYAPWRHGLTADEQAALVHYVGTGWRDINPVLRDVKYPPNPDFYTEEQTQRDIASIDAALSATQTNRDVSSWRIVDNAHGSDKPGGYDTLVNMPVGSTFTDPGYVSTSLRPDIVDYFGTPGGESKYATVQINVPSGTHAAYMFGGALSPGQHDMSDERELLIHRNATFKVVSKSTGTVYGKPVLHVALDLLPESKAYDPAESRDPRGEWTASTVTQAAHLTKATGIPSDFTGLNPHQTQALVKTFERLHQQYPLKVMHIDYVGGTHAPSDPYAKLPLPDHSWGHEQTALAQTANYGKGGAYIGLNRVKFSSPPNSPYSAMGIMQRSVGQGWHPPEARDTGYIVAHEFGHVIKDEATNLDWKTVFHFVSRWDGSKGEQLSKYAGVNGEELFAEAFAAHYYGSTNPVAEDMGKLLTTVFGSAPTFASKAFDPSEPRDPHGEWTGGSSEPVFDKATADVLTLDISGDTGIGQALKNHTDAVNGILRRLPKSATDLLIHGQRQDIAEESPRYQVRRMLSMWAGGSSGSVSRLLLQKAAIEEFGASPNARNKTEHELAQQIAEGRYEHDLAADARVLADEDARKRRVAWYRAVLRVMYDNTQAYLKERGITHVPVARGIGYYDTPSWLRDMPGNQPVPRETKNLFPLTSWSTSTKAAGVFAGVSRASRTGVLLRATVPASRVLSFPMTGLGATDESEVVLLDGPGQALVEKLVMRPDGSSGSEKAFDSEEPRDLHSEWERIRSRNTDIAAALQKDFPSLASVDLHNFTPRSASAIATEFRKLAAEYPKVAKYHVSAIEALNPALGHGTALAVTTTQGALQFNPVWFGSDDAWDMMVDKSESGGFHRRGLVSREAVVDHEFGHLVAEALPLVPRTQFIADEYVNSNQGMLEAALGKYGASRSGEALAESFAIMRNRPQAEWQWFTDDYAKLLTQNQASLKSRELKGPQELLDYSGEAPESLAASGIDPASLVTTADELALRRQLEQLYASVLENTHQALQTQLGAQWGLSPDAVDAYRAQAGDAASGIIETTRSVMSPVMADVIEAGRTAERLGVGFNVREILMQALRDLWVFGPQRGEKIGLTEVVKATNQSVALSLMSAFLQGIEFPQGELVGLRYTDGDETSPWGPCGMFFHDDPVKMMGYVWRFDSGQPMPPEMAHPNCLVAGTRVMTVDGPARAAFSRWFDGEVVILSTANDQFLTATPNHPVLTDRGWLPIGSLREGDYVVCCADTELLASIVGPDNNQRPAMIEDIARSLGPASGGSATSMPAAPEQFHGDGGAEGDVYVVRTNGSAQHGDQVPFREPAGQDAVVVSDSTLSRFLDRGSLDQFPDISSSATHGSVGSSRPTLSDISRSSTSGYPLGLAMRSQRPAKASKCDTQVRAMGETDRYRNLISCLTELIALVESLPPRHISRNATLTHGEATTFECQSETLVTVSNHGTNFADSFTGLVQLVRVRDIVRRHFSGHVYNLETGIGWYIANGIVTHNCVRAAYPYFEELQQPPGENEEENKARQWRKTQRKLRGLWAVLGVKYDPEELRDPHGRWTATIAPGASPHDIQAADRLILPDPATAAKPSDEQQKRARSGAVQKLSQRIMADPQAIAAFKHIYGLTNPVSAREVATRVLLDMTDWGNSSRSPESLTMQRAAVDEFGLESTGLDHCITRAEQDFADEEAQHAKQAFLNDAQPPHDTQADLDRLMQQAREAAPAKMHAQMARLWSERGDWYRRELRHMYEQTQDAFKDAGITRVGLMRGLSWIKASDAPKPVQAAVYHIQHTHEPAELPIVSQPMTSWTARTNVVHNFTQRGPGLVLMATVPVERILSMPLTGHGNLTEHEYVVLAGPGKAEVHTTDLTHFRREAWPMMAEPKTAAIDIQAVWLEHAVLQDMLAKLVAQPSTAKLLAAQVELEQQSAWLLDVIANMQVKTTAPTRLRHVSQPLKLPWQRSEAGDDVEEPIDGGHWVTIGSNHVYIDGAGGSGSVLTDGQLGVADGVIRELARLPTETIRVYDRSGKLLFSRTGSTERIQLSPDEIDLLRSEGAWAIHNHPEALGFPKGDPRRETGHSFSPDDVGMAIGQHMAETQVIAGNTLYTLRPGKDGWGSQSITEVQDAVNTEFEKVRVQYQGEIDSFRRTHANGVAHMWDTVWHRLAKRYGWHYSHTRVTGIDDKGALVLPSAQRMLNVCDVKNMWLADWRFVESKFDPGEPRDETGRWTDGTPIVPGADGDLMKRTDALIWGDKPGPMGNSPFLEPEVERQLHRVNREAFITRVLSSERAMNAWNTTFVGPDKFYSDRLQDVSEASRRERIHDSFLEDKQAWSQSATNATALALQRAAVEEFGLSSDSLALRNRAVAREHLGPSLLKDADEEYAKYGPWLRAEVRTIYDLTQARLRTAGVSHVALLRGLKWDDKKDVPQAINRVLPDMLNGKGEVELRQQPISSWTARKDVAERFAQTKYAVILKATVPASRVFSFAGSGYGVMDEHEFLVLDSPGKASIEFQPYSAWPMDVTADVLAHPGKYPAKEFDPNQARDEHGRWTSGQLEATPGDLAPAPLTEPSPPELSEQDKATLAEATRAIQTCLRNGTVHLDGVNPEYATQLAAQMQTLNKAWPELTKDLTFFGTPDVEWDKDDARANDLSGWQHAQFTPQDYLTSAETRSGIPVPEPTSGGVRSSLVLNPRFWGNPPLMNATLEESARNHWTFSPGSDTVRATLTHEMGHVMIKYLMYRSPESRAAWDTFTKAHTKLAWATTSRYAATGAEEAFAEAFGALHCQKPEQWSTFTRAVAAYLDKQGVFAPPAAKAFQPDEPRDDSGRWTAASDVQPDALLPHYDGQYSALHDELPSDQRTAVEDYVDTGYNFTNAKLRGTQPHTAGAMMYVRTPEQIAEIVKQIDAAQLAHPLAQDTTVYRGTFTDDSGHYPAWTESLQPGFEFTDHAFVSTTTDPGLVRRWFLHGLVHPTIMTINVPKGTPSLFLGHFNTPNYPGEDVDEHELLLARDLCYRVTSREITSDGLGTLHITAEVVPKVTA